MPEHGGHDEVDALQIEAGQRAQARAAAAGPRTRRCRHRRRRRRRSARSRSRCARSRIASTLATEPLEASTTRIRSGTPQSPASRAGPRPGRARERGGDQRADRIVGAGDAAGADPDEAAVLGPARRQAGEARRRRGTRPRNGRRCSGRRMASLLGAGPRGRSSGAPPRRRGSARTAARMPVRHRMAAATSAARSAPSGPITNE